MGRIQILPPALADRIAAGEVVERPASIVRELLDNALDAGATRIDIELEGGGIELVSVADDGRGIDPDDAPLAFARHATSKIATGDDLDRVETLGFRGEALAAIGAVAHVELVSRAVGADHAVRVVVERGSLVECRPTGRAPGTTLTVRELFAGIPARRKFLKGAGTELEHCLAAATRAALSRWEVGFRVRHHGRELLQAPIAAGPAPRIADLLGRRGADGLVAAVEARGSVAVELWAGRSDLHRPTRDGIHLYVNRRPVRDPLLMRAVLDAYRSILPPGRFPMAVVFVALPPTEVDVNVHPAKSEVRFHRPQEVRAAVVAAIAQALGTRDAIPHFTAGRADFGGAFGADAGATAPGWDGLVPADPPGWDGTVRTPPLREGSAPEDDSWGTDPPARGAVPWSPGPGMASAPPSGAAMQAAEPGLAIPGRPRVRALAQYRNCYILAEDARGLLVVDQHVAHERMLYEQLIRNAAGSSGIPRQALLFPAPLELAPGLVETVVEQASLLEQAGFAVEPFGPTTVRVREVPAILGRQVPPEALADLLEGLRIGDRPRPDDLFQHLLATVACHSAVRKGMPLTPEKMDYLLAGLDLCEAPSHCPHGRIVSLRIDLGALDRTFDRNS